MCYSRFRWAACQLDSLSNCLNLPQLRNVLESLPRTLDDTYERILCNIDESCRAYAMKLLQWLTFSARPLKLEELAELVTIEIEDTVPFDPERRFPEPREILKICSNLVSLSDETVGPDNLLDRDNRPDDLLAARVSLAHFSVQEYLLSDRIHEGKASVYSIQKINSHIVIAEDCLTYLVEVYKLELLPSDNPTALPLAEYAANFCCHHARKAEESNVTTTAALMFELLHGTSAIIDEWFETQCFSGCEELARWTDVDDNCNYDYFTQILRSPLHYASKTGLHALAKLLLDKGHDVNALVTGRSNVYQVQTSPLCQASMYGHLLTVKLLLENGANINFNGYIHGGPSELSTALSQACRNGHEPVVRLLLDRYADVNAGDDRITTLQIACRSTRCILQILKWLLEEGAKIDTQTTAGNALQAASLNGGTEKARLLIEKGADVNTQGGKYGNALQAASNKGRKDCVKFLLQRGANVNAQGGEYGNALQAASSDGHKDCVELLLQKGANVNAQGGEYGNALQAASLIGRKGCMELLIQKGAEVNAQGGRCGNALQAASLHGWPECVVLLLQEGAEVNAQGGEYGNALQAGSRSRSMEIAQILIAHGANPKAQGGRCGNA